MYFTIHPSSLGLESLGIYRMSGKVEEITLVKESFNSGMYEHYQFEWWDVNLHIYWHV